MRRSMGSLLAIALLAGMFLPGLRAEASPVLLELFTSQGCSSCPAADAFVGELRSLGYGPDEVVPLTFHVSYWDDLGWEDPYGQDAFNLRQMAYAQTFAEARDTDENTIRGPYTPQMVVDGRVHFSGAMRETAIRRIEEARKRPSGVIVDARASLREDSGEVTVEVTARPAPGRTFDTDRAKIGIFAALYQKRVSTPVASGENAGKTLQESFVVRRLVGPKLFRGERAVNETSFDMKLPEGVPAADVGVAVFVQAMDTMQVLAALQAPVEDSPPRLDLLFMSNRDGNAEIYLRKAGTETWTNLTNHPGVDNWPVWSPDGTRIAFHATRDAEKLDVWVMNADGSHPRRLTDHPDHDYLPSWSPDGKRIAFASWRTETEGEDRAPHLYVMNADGTDQKRLIAESTNTSGAAAWTPDGSGILYTRKVGERADLFLAATDGKGAKRLTDDDAYEGSAVFSPDGRDIAFYSDDGTVAHLVVMLADGSGRRLLPGNGNAWYPRWSPDGKWIVYTGPARSGEEEDLDLFAVRADGSGEPVRILGSPAREAEGSWRPR